MSEAQYKLTASLKGHEDDVRGVVFPAAGAVISASRDATVRTWRTQKGTTDYDDLINTTGSAFVNAVAFLQPTPEYPNGLIISGGQETIIDVRDPTRVGGDADFLLLGHQHNICSLDTFGQTIVSGSWDGTARVWQNWDTKHVLTGHEGAVWAVLALNETDIVTGGADKTIRLWRNGQQIAVLNGHTDCVRGLCRLPNGLFASCANDATIRIWSQDGTTLQELHGHTNYIYSIAALPSGEIVSSGEDRTVKIWKDGECVQTITHPAISVWSVAVCPENGDIVSGASDRVVRVFSRASERWASAEVQAEFDQSVAASAIPANQVGNIQKDKLRGLDALQEPGKKDGQVIMVNNGDKVEAYTWSAADRTWVNVGTVVDAVGSGQKRLYNGKEYDFVFDVDIEEGKPALKLPYNASENPFDAARRFLENNDLPISYLDTVGQFIVSNSQGVSIGQAAPASAPDPWGSDRRYRPGDGADNTPAPAPPRNLPRFLPHKEYLTIATANLAIVEKKFKEFNEKIVDENKDISLNPDEVAKITALCGFLQKSISGQKPAATSAVSDGLLELIKVITQWPVANRLPALDLLRLMTAYSSEPVDYSADGKDLLDILASSGSVSKEQVNNSMLTTRAFANMFQTEAGRSYIDTNYERVLELVKGASEGNDNRNLKVAEATLLLNYSILFSTNKVADKAVGLLDRITNLIKKETDAETAFRLLVALGTLLTMGAEVKEAALGIYEAKSIAKATATRITEARIVQIVEDIDRVLTQQESTPAS